MDKRDAKAMAEDSYKDLKIDVDFKDTCIDFGKYVCEHWVDPSITVEELWTQYQEYMSEEVFKVLNTDDDEGYIDYFKTFKMFNPDLIGVMTYEEWLEESARVREAVSSSDTRGMGIPRDALNPDLRDTLDKIDAMFDKPSKTVEELTGVIDEPLTLNVNKLNRLEIINHAKNDKAIGRLLTLYKELKDFKTLELSVQDDGKTLKIFLN